MISIDSFDLSFWYMLAVIGGIAVIAKLLRVAYEYFEDRSLDAALKRDGELYDLWMRSTVMRVTFTTNPVKARWIIQRLGIKEPADFNENVSRVSERGVLLSWRPEPDLHCSISCEPPELSL